MDRARRAVGPVDGEARDEELVQAARGGDKGAFGELIRRHRPLLLGVCRRALGDPVLAEDAAQEAVLQALLGLDRLRDPARFGSWLAGIGLNLCHRLRRQRAREAWSWEAILGGRTIAAPADPAPGLDELAEARDLRDRIERAVARLPPGQRAAVALHYLEGLTQAETALLLGIETGAVKTRLHKARRTLRRLLWSERPCTREQKEEPNVIAMRVVDVRRIEQPDEAPPRRHVVVLGEAAGSRRLPIWIGEPEATALALHLERIAMPRPLTYAFAAEVLRAAGGELREVRVDRLEGEVFYGTAVIAGPDGEQEIDARPSDALNLAVLLGAPIRVATDVLEACLTDPRHEKWLQLDQAAVGAAAIAAQVASEWDPPASEPPAAEADPEPH